jgi:phosphoribosylamine---glycine ligase
MNKQNVLVLGSGGREHAICWKLTQSQNLGCLYCIPGNAGIEKIAQTDPTIDMMDFPAVKAFAEKNNISLIIVGKENPLVKGIKDFFNESGISVFGPDRHSAQLEGSKIFTKNFFTKYEIPTPKFHTFFTHDDAIYYIKTNHEYPIVIKADGLAQGKGVMIAYEEEEALQSIKEMMEYKKFKAAGEKIVIEEYLDGRELSYQIILDSGHYIDLIPSQDYKNACEDNKGPNTGGMGNIAPPPWLTEKLTTKIKETIVTRVVDALTQESIHYSGILFLGIMVVKDMPYVLEINVRFGDPEAQVLLPLLKTDFLTLVNQVCEGNVKKIKVDFSKQKATCIVLASKGYPSKYQIKKEIKGIEDASDLPNVYIFHAGTSTENGKLVTNGGRVLNVVGLGDTSEESRKTALNGVSKISFDGMFFRKDIGR